MIKLIFIFFTCWIPIHSLSAAFITESAIDGCFNKITISGIINSEDSLIFQKKYEKLKLDFENSKCKKVLKDINFSIGIDLNSRGGNLNESMKIGSFIRAKELNTSVAHDKECLSSCVFILAAGVTRVTWGKIGIHRPYFEHLKSGTTISEIKQIREENTKVIKEYFNKMDISELIVDEMLSIEPDKIKVLNENELIRFRLSLMDSDYEERSTAEGAKDYNITSALYRERLSLQEKRCGFYGKAIDNKRESEFFKCQNMVMLNISESEFLNREAKAKSTCFKMEQGPNRGRCLFDVRILGK